MRFTADWYNAYQARQCAKTRPIEEPEQASVGTEAALHNDVIAYCKSMGYVYFHGSMAHRTRRVEGEPDVLIFLPGGRFLMVELKTAKGKLSDEQRILHFLLARLGHTVHVVRSLKELVALTESPYSAAKNSPQTCSSDVS